VRELVRVSRDISERSKRERVPDRIVELHHDAQAHRAAGRNARVFVLVRVAIGVARAATAALPPLARDPCDAPFAQRVGEAAAIETIEHPVLGNEAGVLERLNRAHRTQQRAIPVRSAAPDPAYGGGLVHLHHRAPRVMRARLCPPRAGGASAGGGGGGGRGAIIRCRRGRRGGGARRHHFLPELGFVREKAR
jgi:hypothetical protein